MTENNKSGETPSTPATPAPKPPAQPTPPAPAQIPPVVAKESKPAETAPKAVPPLPPASKPVEQKAADSKPTDSKPAVTPAPMPQAARPVPPPAAVAPKPPVPPTPAKPPAPSGGGGTPIWVTVPAFLILAGGLYWVWQDRAHNRNDEVLSLQADLRTAQQRIIALEQRPAPSAPDTARLAALENAVKALAAKPTPDTSRLEQRLASLEAKPAPDTSTLEQRLAAIEAKPTPDVAREMQAAVANVTAEMNAKIASLDSKVQQDLARTTRLRAATAALDAGKPIGDLPGATPALQRFVATPPPTEPALRQSFGDFAAKAEKASQPTAEGRDFTDRMWARAEQLVTVRQGDKVVVGAPAAVTLAAARTKLDAGDLAGAVASLSSLDPAAAAAMEPWKRDAQALLEARAALAAMAAKS